MCDRCKDIRSLVETKMGEVKEHFEGLGNSTEHHIAQILRDDPAADPKQLRQAFTSVGPGFHVAMQMGRVAVEEILAAHNNDTVRALSALTELVYRVQGERHSLLHMETPSGSRQTRPM